MHRLTTTALLGVLLCLSWCARAEHPRVEMRTNLGVFVIELYPERAPITVRHFLEMVRSGLYDGTPFHRLVAGQRLFAGSYDRDLRPLRAGAPIHNEADNGLSNLARTVAMGRDSDPHSATTEFFINLADNSFFDYAEPTPRGWGYCVFGRVAQGWDVVEKLAATPILTGGDFIGDVPAQPLALEQARLLTE